MPYNHGLYGWKNIGEGLLFLGKGLALIARSIHAWDKIDEWEYRRLARLGYPIGESWRANFIAARRRGMPFEHSQYKYEHGGIHDHRRKLPYAWSIIGDWTLKLNYDVD